MNSLPIVVLSAVALLASGCSGDDGGGADTTTAASSSGGASSDSGVDDGNDQVDTSGDDVADSEGSGPTPTGTDDAATEDGGTTTGEQDGTGTTTGSAPCRGMSFFATSVGSGDAGGNLGGLEGADATCQALADAVGQGACTWRAYLSTAAEDARDRIGDGPWQNFAGDTIAATVDALHQDGLSNGMPQHISDENGAAVPGNQHDILTGSQEDGTLLDGATCADWTSSEQGDEAGVGHSDIPNNPMFSPSWNAAHVVGGCRPQDLQSTGGAGRLYCFAQ